MIATDAIRLEAFTYTANTFVVGVSRLGVGVLTVGDGTRQWRAIECDANTVEIHRGGLTSAVSTAVDVGTLSARLIDAGDPTRDPGLIPNVPIRAVTNWDLFAGPIEFKGTDSSDDYEPETHAVTFTAQQTTADIFLSREDGSYGPVLNRFQVVDDQNRSVYDLDAGAYESEAAFLQSAAAQAVTSRPAGGNVDLKWSGPVEWLERGAYFTYNTNKTDPYFPENSLQGDYLAVHRVSGLTVGKKYTIKLTADIYNSPVYIGIVGQTFEKPTALFTGKLQDVDVFKRDGLTFVTISAVDAIHELQNTPRYGAKAPADVAVTTSTMRIESLLAPTGIPEILATKYRTVPEDADTFNSITSTQHISRWGKNPSGVSTQAISIAQDPSGFNYVRVRDSERRADKVTQFSPLQRGIKINTSALGNFLMEDHFYVASFRLFRDYETEIGPYPPEADRYAIGIEIDGQVHWARSQTLTERFHNAGEPGGEPDILSIGFFAKQENYDIYIARDTDRNVGGWDKDLGTYRPEDLRIIAYALVAVVEDQPLDATHINQAGVANTDYESTVYNHVEATCNTAGLYWWINRDGNYQDRPRAARQRPPVREQVIELSDRKPSGETSNAFTIGYSDITTAYDTRNLVNILEYENHGTQNNPDRVDSTIVDDWTYQTSYAPSVTQFNARLEKLPSMGWPLQLELGAQQIFDVHATPSIRVRQVVIPVFDHLEALGIDLYTTVRVRFENILETYDVIGINDVITAKKWLRTLELVRRK